MPRCTAEGGVKWNAVWPKAVQGRTRVAAPATPVRARTYHDGRVAWQKGSFVLMEKRNTSSVRIISGNGIKFCGDKEPEKGLSLFQW